MMLQDSKARTPCHLRSATHASSQFSPQEKSLSVRTESNLQRRLQDMTTAIESSYVPRFSTHQIIEIPTTSATWSHPSLLGISQRRQFWKSGISRSGPGDTRASCHPSSHPQVKSNFFLWQLLESSEQLMKFPPTSLF